MQANRQARKVGTRRRIYGVDPRCQSAVGHGSGEEACRMTGADLDNPLWGSVPNENIGGRGVQSRKPILAPAWLRGPRFYINGSKRLGIVIETVEQR